MAVENYDCIVIGSGQAGTPLVTALAKAGYRTALIEREHIAGTCINEGCTPTKTMVASARVAYLARRAADYGVHTGPVTVDMVKVRQRKRDIVNSFRSSSERRLQGVANLDVLFGEASFSGPKTMYVRMNDGSERDLVAERIFINTGARPSIPAIDGLDPARTLNSTTIMELDAVPEHLIVLGGGYVGLEFGQMFRRFGARVTIIQRGARLLTREDGDVADEVAKILREDGIDIHLEATPTRVAANGAGFDVTIKTPSGEQVITGSHILAAAGRSPNTETMNLEAAGVRTEKGGFIAVNERLETSAPSVWALGDVKGGPAFTHISYDDYRIIRDNLLEGGSRTTNDRPVPYTVFIDPQLGRMGLGEEEARTAGKNIKVAKMPMSYVARADEVDETRGFMKAVVDAESGQILGCAILGIEGGELMAMVEIAMMGKVPYTTLRDAVFAHPTLSESLNNLFSNFEE
ncbi:MAG TPA: mercuric reductase [Ktedonobacterales bacterium]|nr:mercuric reductase [Ktedonobacterales bacterium]